MQLLRGVKAVVFSSKFRVLFTSTDIMCIYLALLNTKRRPLYLKTQSVPRSKHCSSRL